MNAGLTFVWVKKCFSCSISPCSRMIIIFDLHGVISCYSPCMEQFEETMFGSFELRGNAFKNMCGVVIGSDGENIP